MASPYVALKTMNNMSRHTKLLLIFAGGLLALSACQQDQADEAAAFQPNFIFFVTEDISPLLRCYGDSIAHTPNIDKLAEEGVLFTNCYSVAGVCAPSRNSLITGMYPTSIGGNNMRTNRRALPDNIPPYESVPPAGVKCYSEFFRIAGYYSTNNSKEDYQFKAPVTAWDESSDYAHWRNREPGQPFFAIFNFKTSHESQVWDRANDPVVIPGEKVNVPPYYPDNKIVRDDIARVYSNITVMDREVGELIAQLKEDGLMDSTIIVFYSDHGGPLPRQKRSVFDAGLKVPLIVRYPDKRFAGTKNDALVSFVDFPATWLSVADIPVPDYMQGQAFLGNQKTKDREYIYAARDRMDGQYDMVRAVRDKKYKYIRNYKPEQPVYQDIEFRKNGVNTMKELIRLRDLGQLNETQMIWFRPTKPLEELYDCEADPHEINNLAANPEYRDILKELRKAHLAWMDDIGDLGQLSEKEMVWRMWPGGVQQETTVPVISYENNMITISSQTKGASIGFKINAKDPNSRSNWTVYTDPFNTDSGDTIYVTAHRIGFKPSETIIYVAN
jgi:N-sulfoglucosamine sulfohydrolase